MKSINFNFKTLLIAAIAVLTISSCRKDNDAPKLPSVRPEYYVLNEGGFNSNNSSLSCYDLEKDSLINDFFVQTNGRGLGDTGNDAQIYGSKMYIVVNASNTVEVVDAKTIKSIKQISFVDKDKKTGRQPRYVVFNKGKAFVSSYDGTIAVIDTATLVIDKFIKVGRSPEQMAIANNKLYVANSGGLDYPNYDKTVSVVDLNTLTEIKKIDVALNPVGVTASADGKVYIESIGNYDDVKPTLTIINSGTDLVTSHKEFSGSGMTIVGEKAYFLSGAGILEYNLNTDAVVRENIIQGDISIKIPFGLNYDAKNQRFFVCDAKAYSGTGSVLCFDKDGKLLYEVSAGVGPNTVVFLNK